MIRRQFKKVGTKQNNASKAMMPLGGSLNKSPGV